MKNIIKYLFLVTLVCGVTSCEDFLTPEPTAQLSTQYFYSNDDEVEAAVTALYYTIRTGGHGTTYTSSFNGFSDEDIHYNVGDDRIDCYSMTATTSNVLTMWSGMYSGLKNIAYLLEGIEENKDNLSDAVYKNAKGEALFLRGYFHFMLAQWFCHPDTGIPMYISTIDSYEGASMPISKLHEHYIQIEADMKAAEELLDSTQQTWSSLGYSERVTVTAIQGMLARVALHAAGCPNYGGYKYGGHDGNTNNQSDAQGYYYKLALEYAEKVINSGQHELTESYSEAFIAPAQDLYVSENIWEIGYHYTGTSGSETNIGGNVGQLFGLGRACDDLETGTDINDSLLVTNYRYMHPRLYVSYELGDDRRDWNYANFTYESNTLLKIPKEIYTNTHYTLPVASGGMGGSSTSNTLQPAYSLPVSLMWGIQPGKWRREYESRIVRDGNSTTTNMPLLRYADVLLMAAEAIIEMNILKDNLDASLAARPMTDAAEYINEVRERAIPSEYATQTWAVSHIIWDENNRGYVEVPEIEVSGGSGSGFEIFTGVDLWSSSHGRLRMGIASMGSGYNTPPTITVKGSRTITWKANTDYTIGDYVSAPTSGSTTQYRIYRATTTGNSGVTSPTHSSSTATPESSTVTWQHISGTYYTTAVAPVVRVIVGQTGVRSVGSDGALVNLNDDDDMRNFIRDERRRELCFENLRRQDLKRWGILYSTMSTMSLDYDGQTEGVIAFGSGGSGGDQITTAGSNITVNNANYLPIPQTQLALNRNLIQNPGY